MELATAGVVVAFTSSITMSSFLRESIFSFPQTKPIIRATINKRAEDILLKFSFRKDNTFSCIIGNAILILMINQIPIERVQEEVKPEVRDYIEIEEDHVYRLGRRTFWTHFYFKYAKYFVLFAILLIAIVIEINFGRLSSSVDNYLTTEWYGALSKLLLSSWIIMIAFSVALVGHLRTYVMYRQHKFHLTANAFHVRRGIFSIKEIVIAYHQIQNVDIRRPLHYRMLGLSKIDISLSNNMPVETHLKGSNQTSLLPVLEKKLARGLAHELVRRGSDFGGKNNQ